MYCISPPPMVESGLILPEGGSAVHHNWSEHGFFTMLIALFLSFVFACSGGTLRMKAPEETELTMAEVISARVRKKK